MSEFVKITGDGLQVSVRVTTRASANRIAGVVAGRVELRVTAAPAEGAANAAVCKLLATAAGVPRGRVTVHRGQRGRIKRIMIVTDAPAEVAARLAAAAE